MKSDASNPMKECSPTWRRRAASILFFVVGLVAALKGIDALLGFTYRVRNGKGTFDQPLYETVIIRGNTRNEEVTILYLGDSVARQLFYPGKEPTPRLRYLTTNAGIGLAGQYYLLRATLEMCPNLRRVRLLLNPHSVLGSLDDQRSFDYFSSFFHEFDQVRELASVKQDFRFTAVHASFWVLPNLMQANLTANTVKSRRIQPDEVKPHGPKPQFGKEPLLELASDAIRRIHLTAAQPARVSGRYVFSPISNYFLPKIRQFCQEHGIELEILPVPCSEKFRDELRYDFYDAPIWFVPEVDFVDSIHFSGKVLAQRRSEYIARFKLPLE